MNHYREHMEALRCPKCKSLNTTADYFECQPDGYPEKEQRRHCYTCGNKFTIKI